MKISLNPETTGLLVQKIGITLFHSLWIGILLAIIAGVVLVSTQKTKPEIRYNVLTGLLCTFVLAVGFAFFLSDPGLVGARDVKGNPPPMAMADATVTPTVAPVYTVWSADQFIGFLAGQAQTITLLWLLIITAKSFRLGLGLYKLHYLKTHQVYSAGSYWEKQVAAFAARMGINRSVRVMQSGLTQVPLMLGHFKPLILLPLGAITSIPADQIEMVLLHELAHIKRLDFFVNFLQHLAELLFFFNPGVLWVCKLIRDERENCCDDMALRYSGNKVTYINALLSFREYQLNNAVYAVAFTNGGLVQRAKRIASRTNTTLRPTEKLLLALTVLMLFTFTILFAQSAQKVNKEQVNHTAVVKPVQKASGAINSQSVNTKSKVNQTTKNQHIKPKLLNTGENQNLSNHLQPANRDQSKASLLMPPDTLQPLRGTLEPIRLYHDQWQAKKQVYFDKDSSGTGTSPLYHARTNGQTYKPQPLQAYQPLQKTYLPDPKRLGIGGKILDKIESLGIEISRDNIDYHISNKELIINGIKQPDHIHKQVIDAVLTGPDDIIDFTYGSHK